MSVDVQAFQALRSVNFLRLNLGCDSEAAESSDFRDSIISVPINSGQLRSPPDEAIVLIGLVKALGFVNEEPLVNIYLQVTRAEPRAARRESDLGGL